MMRRSFAMTVLFCLMLSTLAFDAFAWDTITLVVNNDTETEVLLSQFQFDCWYPPPTENPECSWTCSYDTVYPVPAKSTLSICAFKINNSAWTDESGSLSWTAQVNGQSYNESFQLTDPFIGPLEDWSANVSPFTYYVNTSPYQVVVTYTD